jgi:hypothetical protein
MIGPGAPLSDSIIKTYNLRSNNPLLLHGQSKANDDIDDIDEDEIATAGSKLIPQYRGAAGCGGVNSNIQLEETRPIKIGGAKKGLIAGAGAAAAGGM